MEVPAGYTESAFFKLLGCRLHSLETGVAQVALEWVPELELERRGIVTRLEWQLADEGLSDAQRVTLFRVCQEGLNNVVKHANAHSVTIRARASISKSMNCHGTGLIKIITHALPLHPRSQSSQTAI